MSEMLHLNSVRNAVYNSGYPIDVLNIILEYIQDFSRISAGGFHSVILKDDGTLHAWGYDGYKQISDTPKDSGFISVSSGLFYSVALKDDGTLHDWGSCKDTPKDSGFISVSSGGFHFIALKDDGTLHARGYDDCKQVSDTPKD